MLEGFLRNEIEEIKERAEINAKKFSIVTLFSNKKFEMKIHDSFSLFISRGIIR